MLPEIYFLKNRSLGFSLIELMVALAISLIIIVSSSVMYLNGKQSYIDSERTAFMSQNSRFALEMIATNLRIAGFYGQVINSSITKDNKLSPLGGIDCTGPAAIYDLQHYIVIDKSNAQGQALGCIADAKPNTEVLVIKNVIPIKYIDSSGDGIIDSPQILSSKHSYILSNSHQGILFNGADTQPSLSKGGDVPSGAAWQYQVQIYYIREKKTGPPQLSRKVLSNRKGLMILTTEDLVANVENIHHHIAVDTDNNGSVDFYSSAHNIANWSKVKAITTRLLVRSSSEDFDYIDTKNYLMGKNLLINATNDHYHRTLKENTVSLRNVSNFGNSTL